MSTKYKNEMSDGFLNVAATLFFGGMATVAICVFVAAADGGFKSSPYLDYWNFVGTESFLLAWIMLFIHPQKKIHPTP